MILPFFGEISDEAIKLFSLEEEEFVLETDTTLNGHEITMDINAEDDAVSVEQLLEVKFFLENLSIFEEKIHQQIKTNSTENSEMLRYINHHIEDYTDDVLTEVIDVKQDNSTYQKQMIEKLHCVRVGFYPNEEESFAVFDYSIDEDFTNYLLVLLTDKTGKITDITMES